MLAEIPRAPAPQAIDSNGNTVVKSSDIITDTEKSQKNSPHSEQQQTSHQQSSKQLLTPSLQNQTQPNTTQSQKFNEKLQEGILRDQEKLIRERRMKPNLDELRKKGHPPDLDELRKKGHPPDLDELRKKGHPPDLDELRKKAKLRENLDKSRFRHLTSEEIIEAEQRWTVSMILLWCSIAVSQIIFYHWQKHHKRSYMLLTTVTLWLLPFLISLYNLGYKFLLFWCIFSFFTIRLLLYSYNSRSSIRKIYKWFLLIHRLCYTLAMISLSIIFILIIGGFSDNFIETVGSVSLYILGLSLYFAVLGRDVAEIASDKVVKKVSGLSGSLSLPQRVPSQGTCALCCEPIHSRSSSNSSNVSTLQKSNSRGTSRILVNQYSDITTWTLSCDHVLHDPCVRGWMLVGKQDTCPACKEKVNLRDLIGAQPWSAPSVIWGVLLDLCRYLVVWNPLIFTIAHWLMHRIYGDDADRL